MISHRIGEHDDIDFTGFELDKSDVDVELMAKRKAEYDAHQAKVRQVNELRRNFYNNQNRPSIMTIDKDGSLAESLTKAGFKV